MTETYIFIVVITFGVLIALHGVRLLRSKSKTTVLPPERVLMSLFGGDDPENQLRVLGRIRVVIGIFLIVIGMWAMS